MDKTLEQAITYIKAGDFEKGKQLLIQIIQQNPRDENAWLWMSRCVPVEQKKECFRRAIAINPNNELAQKALEKLSSSTLSSAQTSAVITTQANPSIPAATATRPPTTASAQPSKQKIQSAPKNLVNRSVRLQKKKGLSSKIWLPMVLALITCCGSVIAAFVGSDAVKTIVTGLIPRPDNFTISVHVADKSGGTISGAKVLFFYPAGSLSQYTDSNGVSTFNVSNAGQGNLRVIVETDNYQIFEKQVVYPIETTIDVRLSEKQEGNKNVILRAVTDGSNAPIAGIEVVVTLDGNLFRQATDSDGFALFELPFPSEGQIDAQISVNTQGYGIEDQFSTLTPGKLQYILLTPNSLSVLIPDVPLAPRPSPQSTTNNQNVDTSGAVIGSGVKISQQSGGNGLKVIFLTTDFKPANGFFYVYEQSADVAGGLLKGNQIDGESINKQGELFFEINEGVYVLCQSGYAGYDWTDIGCVYNVQVSSGNQTTVTFQLGQINFTVVDASGNAIADTLWEIYTQTQDVTGKPVTLRKVWSGNTDKTGTVYAPLTPGLYVIDFGLHGYKWGQKPTDRDGVSNIPVKKGEITPILITLGQIAIELRTIDGRPSVNERIEIYTQKNDINGNQIIDNYIGSVYTDDSGAAVFNLTEGLYAVKIRDNTTYNVPINWGVITQTDGTTFRQNK